MSDLTRPVVDDQALRLAEWLNGCTTVATDWDRRIIHEDLVPGGELDADANGKRAKEESMRWENCWLAQRDWSGR